MKFPKLFYKSCDDPPHGQRRQSGHAELILIVNSISTSTTGLCDGVWYEGYRIKHERVLFDRWSEYEYDQFNPILKQHD